MPNDSNIGIITEQGDLGLGFDKLSEKDNKVYTEATNKDKEDKKENN